MRVYFEIKHWINIRRKKGEKEFPLNLLSRKYLSDYEKVPQETTIDKQEKSVLIIQMHNFYAIGWYSHT